MKRSTLGLTTFAAVLLSRLASAGDCTGIEPVAGEEITLETVVASGLARPVDAASPPGDTGRLFVVEQPGRIRIVDLADDTLLAAPFLDIRSRVLSSGNEQGLLGIVFHPRFSENGYFFVNYTRNPGSVCSSSPPPGCTGSRAAETVVARFQVSPGDPNVADPASEKVIISFCQPFSNHNAGQLAFGPFDGYLHVSTGDGGSGGDPCNSGQRTDTLLGKLLRVDVDGGDPYAIPADNPFTGDPDVRDEIWALGLRNPWRFAFDPENGDLYIADVGQGAWEEVDWVPGTSAGGENYEWRVREGNHNFSPGTSFGPGVRTAPVYEYPHGGGVFRGCSITGGVVYRGCRMPDLRGAYFFADFCNNWVATFRIAEGRVTALRDRTGDLNAGIAGSLASIAAFGTDGHGEVYIASLSGRLYRVVPQVSVNNPPAAAIAPDPDPPEVALVAGSARITLDGSGSDDGDGGTQTLAFLWEKLNGPDGDTIETPGAPVTDVQFTAPGEYTYRLTVNDGELEDTAQVTVTVLENVFRRGDSNVDRNVDLSDGVRTLRFLFRGDPPALPCRDAADADDGGTVELTDAVFTFEYLFRGGELPPPPGPVDCGPDRTEDPLECREYPECP